PATFESYVVLARATANRAVAAGRLEPRRAAALIELLNDARAQFLGVSPTLEERSARSP
nr:hypothetical protein [Propionibacteriales bacterium]